MNAQQATQVIMKWRKLLPNQQERADFYAWKQDLPACVRDANDPETLVRIFLMEKQGVFDK